MRSKIFSLLLVALALPALAPTAFAAGQTAKAALPAAMAEAKKWQADAVLTNAVTQQANADGTAEQWDYLFFSPRANNGFSLTVRGGKVVDTLEVRPHVSDPIGSDFLDSDQAMKEALKNGFKSKGKVPMSVLVMGQATKQPGVYWSVGTGYMPGEVSVILEAKTGKLVTRREIK